MTDAMSLIASIFQSLHIGGTDGIDSVLTEFGSHLCINENPHIHTHTHTHRNSEKWMPDQGPAYTHI